MKLEKNNLAENILAKIVPEFKGLSEKSARKMYYFSENVAKKLSKHFFKLQEHDFERCIKLEKTILKKQKQTQKKAIIDSNIAKMLGTQKPQNLILIPEKITSSPVKKNPIKK